MKRGHYYADFVTVPATIILLVAWSGPRLVLMLCGLCAWTLAEYLLHRCWMHSRGIGWRLHKPHHDRPADHDAERSSASTPLIATPIALILFAAAGAENGAAIFAGLLLGYFCFIAVHHAVHRWTIEPGSLLYPAKMRHVAHHHFNDRDFGVITSFWDVVFRTRR